MLADWEHEHPGRIESIFSALRNVAVSHLADPAAFDFAALAAEIPGQPTDRDGGNAAMEPWHER
jgi:tRNA 2-thiocytidine biosynthesis protein TtcA